MELPSKHEFLELRRLLPIVAAVAFVASLAFPMWRIEVHAVQYPQKVLNLYLYAYPQLTGDVVEMARLNHYVGFHFPDPVYLSPNYEVSPAAIDVPEWSIGWLAFVVVSLLSLFVAVAPTAKKLARGLTGQLVGTVLVFGVMLADIQYRLWQAGNTLDPDAPLMGVEGFTPPLWGMYEVANITSYSRFDLGAFIAIGSVVLLAVAFYFRHSETTLMDVLPGIESEPPERSEAPDPEVEDA
jgi:hypothetical protein